MGPRLRGKLHNLRPIFVIISLLYISLTWPKWVAEVLACWFSYQIGNPAPQNCIPAGLAKPWYLLRLAAIGWRHEIGGCRWLAKINAGVVTGHSLRNPISMQSKAMPTFIVEYFARLVNIDREKVPPHHASPCGQNNNQRMHFAPRTWRADLNLDTVLLICCEV